MEKVFCLSALSWKIIFLCIQMATLALIIGSMGADYWFYQKWEYNKEKLTYRGKLLVTISDLGFCDYGSSYNYCYHECRDRCNDYSKCLDTCDRYKHWHEAGVAYLLCDLGAGLFVIFSILITIFTLYKRGRSKIFINLVTSTFFLVLAFFAHILAFAIYVGKTDLKSTDCTHDYDYDGQKSICMKTGPFLAISIMVWFFILIPVKFYIARLVYIEEKNEERALMG